MTAADTLISADRVLTGVPGESVDGGAVLVREGRIVGVGPRDELVGRGAAERHHPGATVLPGLINTHVHLVFDASLDPVGAFRDATPEALYPAMAGRAAEALGAGVTTVRDLGDAHGLAFRLRDEIAAGTRPGPRVLASGSPLTVPGGHCWFLGGEVDGPDAIRARIRELAAAGADLIKVMVGGGHMTPGGAMPWDSQFGVDDVAVAVEEARAVGLTVAAHAHGLVPIAVAVAAGVHTVEHCTWMVGPGQQPGQDRAEVVAAMAAAGIHAGDTTPPNWPLLAEMLPMPPGRRFGDQLRFMEDAGVSIVLGTDAGMPGSVFGDIAGALTLYREHGFTPERIIRLLTVDAAAALGLGAVTGRLAPDLAADVLVVGGDPRADTDALRDVRLVLAAGRVYEPPPVGPVR